MATASPPSKLIQDLGAYHQLLTPAIPTLSVLSIDANSDLYASAEYRLHLARVHAARALRTALSRAE
jgi:CO/xanthine dehydrogenase FAD-binding subunit